MKGWLALCCAVCMLVGAMAAAESPTENGFSALELPADEILDMNLDRNPRHGSDPVDADRVTARA